MVKRPYPSYINNVPSTSRLRISNEQGMAYSHNNTKPAQAANKRVLRAPHSGHFMKSTLSDDEDQEEAQDLSMKTAKKLKTKKKVVFDKDLNKLFACMTIAYRGKLVNPKFNPFKGLKLDIWDKMRLNNIIWREWHLQFVFGHKPLVCSFTVMEEPHTRPQSVVLEGKYWKRQLQLVTAEYMKWRKFFKRQARSRNCRPSDHLPSTKPRNSRGTNEQAEVSSPSQTLDELLDRVAKESAYGHSSYHEQKSHDDHSKLDFSDMFTNISQPSKDGGFCGFGGVDFMQPNLVGLQPALDELNLELDPFHDIFNEAGTWNSGSINSSLFGGSSPTIPTGDPENKTNHHINNHSYNMALGLPTPVSLSTAQPMQIEENGAHFSINIKPGEQMNTHFKQDDHLHNLHLIGSPNSAFTVPELPMHVIRDNEYMMQNQSRAQGLHINQTVKTPGLGTVQVIPGHNSFSMAGQLSMQQSAPTASNSGMDSTHWMNNSNTQQADQFSKPKNRAKERTIAPRITTSPVVKVTPQSFPTQIHASRSVLTQLLSTKQAAIQAAQSVNQSLMTSPTGIIEDRAFAAVPHSPSTSDWKMSPQTSPSTSADFRSPSRDDRKETAAELKRKHHMKNGFDVLHTIIPALANNPTNKVSKAAMLMKTAEYAQKLKSQRQRMHEEADILRTEVEALNSSIISSQCQLPATGVPVTRQSSDHMKAMLEAYVRERTIQNWKFYIFSQLGRPLFESFNSMVSTANQDELYRTTQAWLDQHCALPALRPAALAGLRDLGVNTSILSDPSKLPEQARKAVTETPPHSSDNTS